MRGTGGVRRNGVEIDRFIPAYAGNSAVPPIFFDRSTVHPRVCGEQPLRMMMDAQSHGSSPRMRGTEPMPGARPAQRRFIPAYAGNRTGAARVSGYPTVHPRVCGEQSTTLIFHCLTSGSSPRMRGTDTPFSGPLLPPRFIPAYAGNRTIGEATRSMTAVHPRVCGEQGIPYERTPNEHGSSPRMRGTVLHGL